MADLLNLNRARKKKRATEKEKDAAANRAKHGRTKAERENEEAQRRAREQLLDGCKRDED